MGLQSLQDFVDSANGVYETQLSKFLEESLHVKTSNLLLVHADSCLRHFYNEHVDWVCGGQWCEFFQSVEKFVRLFRQADLELVVFFNGSLNDVTINQWAIKHRFIREIVKETLSHIIHNRNIPFRTKTKNFVPPGALKSALRLAFRACEVMVCSSVEDIYKESILYSKDENSLGIIANDANYFLCKAPHYVSLGNIRWQKKVFNACKVYDFNAVLKHLHLNDEDLPYLAALLGNSVISDKTLSAFYWELIEDDHPLKKIQANLTTDAVLPPTEVRLKCVAKFLQEKGADVRDVNTLGKLVFEKCSSITVEEGTKMLSIVISSFQEKIKASKSAVCTEKDIENHLSVAGFPLPTTNTSGEHDNRQNCYKKCWVFKSKQTSLPLSSTQTAETQHTHQVVALEKLDDPEKILKEGTLEEAAQALEQLELKETAAAEEDINIQKEQQEQMEVQVSSEAVFIADEEKPSIVKDDEAIDLEHVSDDILEMYSREISIAPVKGNINEEVLKVTRKRHQSGQMCPEILQLLTKGEIVFDMAIDDELATSRFPIPLIYRPLRQLVYGVLFGVKQSKEVIKTEEGEVQEEQISDETDEQKEEKCIANGVSEEVSTSEPLLENETADGDSDSAFTIKEWCIYEDKELDKPDLVKAKGMSWGIPSLQKLWFGVDSEDNANRLKAFLSCMKSDTINMSNTAMVPQRLMLLCCVLRYLVQQDTGKSVLTKQDIDAFLAQALSTHLTTEYNIQNLANIKLNQIDARCVQLAAIFMSGIENAILANDACGSPIPWEFCCPWNFFDGKLFHSKWLQATLNVNATDLCDGKPHLAEKLERLRWCITEGLESKYTITGLQQSKKFFNPFGNPPSMQSGPLYGVMRPAGSFPPPLSGRMRSRGPGSKRPVHGSGGTLHVAGVPVAHWGGNKSGFGYSKHGPNVLVGGPNSVVLPSNQRRNGGGRGGRFNRGRGLLETPYVSPWQQHFGFEDYVNSTYQHFMKGVQKAEQVRTKIGKMGRQQVYSSRTRHQQYQNNISLLKPTANGKSDIWLGKGRGQGTPDVMASPLEVVAGTDISSFGRGQWLNAAE